MASATDIVGYTYAADLYCCECVLRAVGTTGAEVSERYVEPTLDQLAQKLGIDRHDESSFDSGDFPKVVFRDMLESETCSLCDGRRYDEDGDPCERCDGNGYVPHARCVTCGEVLGG